MPLWLIAIWNKFGTALTWIGGVLAAAAAIFFIGRSKGKEVEKAKNDKANAERVEVEKEAVKQIDQQHEDTRAEVEKEIEKIPAPNETNEPVRVADAPKDSAAGKLKDW